MSWVGRTWKTAGATTAPKKSGGPKRQAERGQVQGQDQGLEAGIDLHGSGAYSAVTAGRQARGVGPVEQQLDGPPPRLAVAPASRR